MVHSTHGALGEHGSKHYEATLEKHASVLLLTENKIPKDARKCRNETLIISIHGWVELSELYTFIILNKLGREIDHTAFIYGTSMTN